MFNKRKERLNDEEPLNSSVTGTARSPVERDDQVRGRNQHDQTAETRRRTNSNKARQRATSPMNRATIHERVQNKLMRDQRRRKRERRRHHRQPAHSPKQGPGVTLKPLNDAMPKPPPPRTRSSNSKGSGKFPWPVSISPPLRERSATKAISSNRSYGGILDDLTVTPVSLFDYFTGSKDDSEDYDDYDDYEDCGYSDEEYDDDSSYCRNEEVSNLERNIEAETSQFVSIVSEAANQFDMAAGPVLDSVSKFMGGCMNLDGLENENIIEDNGISERDEDYSRGSAEVSIVSADSIASNNPEEKNLDQCLDTEIDSVMMGENSLVSVESKLHLSTLQKGESSRACEDVGSLQTNSKKQNKTFGNEEKVDHFKEVHVTVTALALYGLTVESKSNTSDIDENLVKAVLSVPRLTISNNHAIYTHIPSLPAVRDPIKSARDKGQAIANPPKKHHLLVAWPSECVPVEWEEQMQIMEGSYECTDKKIAQKIPNKQLGALVSSIRLSRLISVSKFKCANMGNDDHNFRSHGEEGSKQTFMPSVVEMTICIMKENSEILSVGLVNVVVSGEDQDAEVAVPVIQDYKTSFKKSSSFNQKNDRKSKSFVRFKSAKEEAYSLEPDSFLLIRLQVHSTRQERNSPYPPVNLGLSILTPNYIPKGEKMGKLSLVLRKRYKKHLKAERRLQSLKFALAKTQPRIRNEDENHTATSDGSSLGSTAGGAVDRENISEETSTDKVIQRSTPPETKAPEKVTVSKSWTRKTKTDKDVEGMTNGSLAATMHKSNDATSMNELSESDVDGDTVDDKLTTTMAQVSLKKQNSCICSKSKKSADIFGFLPGRKLTDVDGKNSQNDSSDFIQQSLSMGSENFREESMTKETELIDHGNNSPSKPIHVPQSHSNISESIASVILPDEKSSQERDANDVPNHTSCIHHFFGMKSENTHAESVLEKPNESVHGAKALTQSSLNKSALIFPVRLPGKNTQKERVVKDVQKDFRNYIHRSLSMRSDSSRQGTIVDKIEEVAESSRQTYRAPRSFSNISGATFGSSGKKPPTEPDSDNVQNVSSNFIHHSLSMKSDASCQDVIVEDESVAPTVIATLEEEDCREYSHFDTSDPMNVMLQINYTYSRGTTGEQQEDDLPVAESSTAVSPSAKSSEFSESEFNVTANVGKNGGGDIESEGHGVEICDLEHILEQEEEIMEPDDGLELSTPCEI